MATLSSSSTNSQAAMTTTDQQPTNQMASSSPWAAKSWAIDSEAVDIPPKESAPSLQEGEMEKIILRGSSTNYPSTPSVLESSSTAAKPFSSPFGSATPQTNRYGVKMILPKGLSSSVGQSTSANSPSLIMMPPPLVLPPPRDENSPHSNLGASPNGTPEHIALEEQFTPEEPKLCTHNSSSEGDRSRYSGEERYNPLFPDSYEDIRIEESVCELGNAPGPQQKRTDAIVPISSAYQVFDEKSARDSHMVIPIPEVQQSIPLRSGRCGTQPELLNGEISGSGNAWSSIVSKQSKLKYVPPFRDDGKLKLPKGLIQLGVEKWKNSLVRFFIEKQLP